MFSLLIAPLYLRPNGEPISFAVYSLPHPRHSPWGDTFRVDRWWRA